MFIDIELQAYFPKVDGHMTRLVFEQGTSDFGRGEVGGAQSGFSISEHSTPFQTGGNPLMSARNGFGGHYVVGGSPFTSPILLPQADITSMVSPETQSQFPCSIRPDNPAVWHGGGNKMQANTAWPSVTGDNATRELPPSLAGGAWGALDGAGMGTPFSQDEGSHKWRCAFDEGGMTFYLDDAIQGKYVGAGSPVYSFKLQACSFNLDSTSSGNNDDSLEKVTEKQLYVDEITVRQVPSLAMLPFTIETTVINEDAGKYKTLTVFADNVISANDYDVKVSICTPGDTTGIWAGYGRSPGTPIADFESLDLQIAGGYGSTDLTDLPASVYVDGFTIRWEFWVPNVGSENAPVNWDSLPEISNWKITFDNMPTATCAVTGNTFNNDLSSPITTEVGHIVTFYSTGTTIDPDRLMTHVKYDFGDGTITDWIAIAVPALTVNHTITHAYSVAATALNMTAMYKDDNENESAATTAIVVNVNATNPVAALRASPMMVRAGQTVRLDGSKSYDVDSTTLTDFTFTPGDGSTAIGPQYANYADHTYAVAGEYRATLTCEDSTGNTSNMATCIIKVLPANLVIPLTLNTMPSEFSRTRQAKYHSTPVLDAAFPELRDTGQRSDKFSLRGEFLTETADVDIAFMEELLMSGALVEFEWQAVNYIGTPDSKTFVGRMTDFSYEREGGKHGQTPYTAQFTREAALGV
jgi:hypothetical protein